MTIGQNVEGKGLSLAVFGLPSKLIEILNPPAHWGTLGGLYTSSVPAATCSFLPLCPISI
ncbi:MAG: hypothetical protein ACPL5I_11585 [Thermodesulfobacteriota bacterium]